MILYIVQTILISVFLSLGYFTLFKNSKQFQIRRALILLIPLFSLFIPFANYISFSSNPIKENVIFSKVLDAVQIDVLQPDSHIISASFSTVFMIITAIISLILLGFLGLRIARILRLKQYGVEEDNVFIISDEYPAFSFFWFIFIPKLQTKNRNLIIEHERVHVSQMHSVDVVYFEILKALFWFNPIFYLLKKELIAVHEFYVDQAIVEQNTNVEFYYELLLANGPLKNLMLGNNFNNSLIKSRFIMMTKKSNKKSLILRLFGMIMVVLSMIFVFQSCNKDNKKTMEQKKSKIEQKLQSQSVPKLDVYPSYPGGDEARSSFMLENTKYPISAQKDSIQGMVYVSFIVSKDGSLKDLKVIRGLSPEIDAEALRVVSLMPNWNPGEKDGKKVDFEFTIPFKFMLSNNISSQFE